MEKTFIRNKGSFLDSFVIHDISIFLFAISLGLLKSNITLCLMLPVLSFVYIRSRKECIIAVTGILLASFSVSPILMYKYMILLSVYFLCVEWVRLVKGNIYQSQIYICTFVSLISVLFYPMKFPQIFIVPFLIYMFMHLFFDNFNWITKEFKVSDFMYLIVLLTIVLYSIQYLPESYAIHMMTLSAFIIALFPNKNLLYYMVLFYALLFPSIPVFPFILLIILVFFRKEKLLSLISLFFIPNVLSQSLSFSFYTGGVLLIAFSDELENVFKKEETLYQMGDIHRLLQKQLNNFSDIFESLSQYYLNLSHVEADMLANMANALQYVALECKGQQLKTQNSYEKIMDAMEAYHYEVSKLSIKEDYLGDIEILLNIKSITGNEVKQVILPLLETLCMQKLELVQLTSNRFYKGFYSLKFMKAHQFTIDAYGDSLKNEYETNGDCFSVFRHLSHVVCTISDGMGNGEKAYQTSRVLTNIFQKMLSANFTQDACIHCMNQLLQSDVYATFDVISFDLKAGKAYISKMAACPTFLLRDKKVIEISGSALPVGIIGEVKPDGYVLEIKENDRFLMVSDGVYRNEINEWIKMKKDNSSQMEVEELINKMKLCTRKDDSTVVLAKVLK